MNSLTLSVYLFLLILYTFTEYLHLMIKKMFKTISESTIKSIYIFNTVSSGLWNFFIHFFHMRFHESQLYLSARNKNKIAIMEAEFEN